MALKIGSKLICEFSMFSYQVELFDAEINLMDHRPSAIAAAAVLVSIDDQFTKKELELKMSVFSLWGYLENVSFLVSTNFFHSM
jgi:hypothetical protein